MTPAETRTDHYARLNAYRNSAEYADWAASVGWDRPTGDLPCLIGDRWEIDEAIFDEFLGMLPPVRFNGSSFYMLEETFDGIRAKFSREGGRYWCEFARLPERVNASRFEP